MILLNWRKTRKIIYIANKVCYFTQWLNFFLNWSVLINTHIWPLNNGNLLLTSGTSKRKLYVFNKHKKYHSNRLMISKREIIPISSSMLNLPVTSLSLAEHNLQSPEILWDKKNLNILQILEWFGILYFHYVVYND